MPVATKIVPDMCDVALRWYLIMTKPANENIAAVNLERQGHGVYFPKVLQKRLRRGKWCDHIAALFPRYMFVQLDANQQALSTIRSTVGVAQVVRFGVDYMIVSSHVIDTLKRNEDPGTGLHLMRINTPFSRGDRVRIAVGSLTGFEGVFETDDGNHRVTILLNMLGRETRLQIDVGCVVSSAA